MARKLQAGDTVICRYFNTPDGKFYGESFTATIVEGDSGFLTPRDFLVRRTEGSRTTYITLWRKEILARVE